MRIVFFGMAGQFSAPPLQTLLSNGVAVDAVIVPAPAHRKMALPQRLSPPSADAALPLLQAPSEQTIIHLAWAHQIPVWVVGRLSAPKTAALLAALKPDLITVACFPYRVPPLVLNLPRFGCVNLHPSLLPAYRGPEPLFWIAYHDERESGVTLHFLDEALDSGDIIAQTRLERPDGLSGAQLEQRCAQTGAALLLDAVETLAGGRPLPRQPQSQAQASYFPAPTAADYLIPTTWTARRAFNFLRGAAGWPLAIGLDGTEFCIRRAIDYAPGHTLNRSHRLLGDELWVQFQPGVLRAKIEVGCTA